jgi:hypothetical protein
MEARENKDPEQWRDMVRNVQTILLSMITAGIIALFGFIWNINGQIIEMRTESAFRYKSIEEATSVLKTIEERLNQIETRVSKLEINKRN